jgi:hypothetical protein
METLFLVVIVVLGALLVVMFFASRTVLKELRSTVGRLEKKVEGLQSDLARQQQNLDDLKAVLQNKPDDPFQSVLQAVDRYQKRGLLPAVAMVGFRLFKSYLNGRARRKALPLLDKSAE